MSYRRLALDSSSEVQEIYKEPATSCMLMCAVAAQAVFSRLRASMLHTDALALRLQTIALVLRQEVLLRVPGARGASKSRGLIT